MFHKCQDLPGVDVGVIDIFFDLTNSRAQLMNKEVPWRSGHDNDSKLLQVIIEPLTKPKDVVLYVLASTRDYVPQCQSFIFDC